MAFRLTADSLARDIERGCFHKAGRRLIPGEVRSDRLGAAEEQGQCARDLDHLLKTLDGAAIQPDSLCPNSKPVGSRIGENGCHQSKKVKRFAGIFEKLCRWNAGVWIDPKGANPGGWVITIGESSGSSAGRFTVELGFEMAGQTMSGNTVIQQNVAAGR